MRPLRIVSLFAATAMVVAVMGSVPAQASHDVNGKVCIVNSIGGPDDPFNRAVAAGAKEAKSKLHVAIETRDGFTETDVMANFDTFVSSGSCDLIVGVGFISGILMQPFVVANPGQDFVAIDLELGGIYPNLAEVATASNEGGFLAGYVAAGVSETGRVGVFGGVPILPVTLFMDGYALGVAAYNAAYGTSVEVLGWDPDLQSGLFAFTFSDPAVGQAIASDLFDLGADTVFPVAGFTSQGALDEAAMRKAAGEDVRVIGVDFDWAGTFGDPHRVILTSVVKDYGPAVFNQIEDLVEGTWTSGLTIEGLAEGTIEIAPFHKLNRVVPGFLKNDLDALRAGIIDGTIPTVP